MEQQNKKILVIFDFCETLVNFQTADAFVNYIFKRNVSIFGLLIEFIRIFLTKSRLISGEINKKLVLLKLKGLSESKIKYYVKQFHEEKLITSTVSYSIDRLKWHQQKGHHIVILSGGYTPYLEYFANYFGIQIAIGTDFKIACDKLTGFYNGLDCLGINKVEKLINNIDLSQYYLSESYCYSDSISDLPIFMLVGNRYLVNSSISEEIAEIYKLNKVP